MNPQQILTRVREQSANFSPVQLASLAAAFVLVVAVVAGSTWWLNRPDYVLLFDDMDPESAAAMVERLRGLDVRYQLDPGGRAVRVPRSRVDELRLELTASGLPASGRVGFEIFDRTSFGVTEFLEKVNYRRALEGEIARTIATIAEVSSARVHIAMGRDSIFGESRPAKASVVVKLRGARPLPAATIAGITNLVAGSVDGLRPESVTILDTAGRPLTRSQDEPDQPMGSGQMERQQRLEHELAARVVSLLAPVVGADRVRVNVALTLNAQSRQETEEIWDPQAVVRSRQVSTDAAATGAPGAGLAGARGNMPPPTPESDQAAAAPPPSLPPGPASESTRSTETINYEVSRTTRQTIQPPGDIARMSVAVILDDNHVAQTADDGVSQVVRVPRTPDDLQKLQDLVAAAVGLDPARGDQLTVQNVSFEEMPIDELAPEGFFVRYAPQLQEGGRLVTTLLVVLAVLLFAVRPLVRRSGLTGGLALPARAGEPDLGRPRTVADLESEIEAQIDAAAAMKAGTHRLLPALTRRVATYADREPAGAAKLLRSWMNESER